MATREQLERALRNADKAGDTSAARRFAMAIRNGEFDQPQESAVQGQFLDVPSPQQDAVVNQYYQQQAQQRANAPAPTMGERAIASGEAGLSMLTGATGGTLGMLAGGVEGMRQNILAGTYGTQQGADVAEQYASDVAKSMTYEPRTPLGGQYLDAVGQALSPLAGLAGVAPLAETAMIGQLARPALRNIPQTPGAQEQAQRIAQGDTSRDLARYRLVPGSVESGAPRRAMDAEAKEAIKQGFDDSVISAIKQSSPKTKSKLYRMATIAEKAADDAVFRSSNRPADVVGDSLAQRLNKLKEINEQAADEIDLAADKIKGKPVDYDTPYRKLISDMESIGVSIDDKGRLNFSGSDLEFSAGDKELLSNIYSRARKTDGTDAYKVHKIKRLIDRTVDYGTGSQSGITSGGESIVKSFRRALDQSLDNTFEDYNIANTKYSDTITALDELQNAAGAKVSLFGPNADKALGVTSRRLTNNTQARANLITALEKIEATTSKYGASFDDDIIRQAIFANELDRRFGSGADTALQNEVGKGVKRSAEVLSGQRTLTGLGIDALSSGADLLAGRNDKNAFKSIKKLLERDAAK